MKVIKKDGTLEDYNEQKIIDACNKAARRAMINLSDDDYQSICNAVWDKLVENDLEDTEIYDMHNIVESVLSELFPEVAKKYMEYRNYKKDFIHMMDNVYERSQTIRYIGDKSNANTDSALVATKRSLIYNELSSELYKKFFLTHNEKQAMKDGYIYIHDRSARLDTFNCCLMRVGEIMRDGFEMGNVWYNEPNSLDTAFDVMGDIILSTAAQQYGGFTVPEVDKILSYYAKKSYWKYREEYGKVCDLIIEENHVEDSITTKNAENYAIGKVKRDFEQGWQGIEYKLNTVGSSRGDYPFVTMTIGLATDEFGKMAAITLLNVHKEGQGKNGFKRPVLFPKIVFLYDENLHGDGSENYPNADVFNAGIECSSKTMYPDWLSLTGNGYVPDMYKRYRRVVSPMGCVDGKEVITYKFNNRLFVESFERMWNRLTDNFEVKQQTENSIHLYMDLNNVLIWDTENGFVNTKRIVRNVSTEWVDVHLSDGRRLLCTKDHPITTKNGETKIAEKLNNNDSILINSSQYCEENIVFNNDKAWLLGFMLCDGCYQNNHIFSSIAAKNEDEIEEKFHKTFQKYFGMNIKTIPQERDKKGTYKDLVAEADDNGGLQSTINYFSTKFGGINKINRHIPNEVFEWNYSSKLAFMAGMIDADGYINPTSHGGSIVQIGSTNKELALQQMALAQSLGMPARIYHNHYTKKNPNAIRYRIEFYPIEELLEYIVCTKKTENYKHALSEHYSINASVIEVLPVKRIAYSYDVCTDSEHFEVSNIYSHNCRAFLSPWYERGGMEPEDDNDNPVFEGRCNLGVVSLNLPMILAKSKIESKDFYEILDYYLELIRGLHQRTYNYIGNLRASVNPIAFCEGGLLGGYLKPEEKIKKLLPPMTMSYGITALNELQELYNGKSIRADGKFALEVMQHIQNYINRIKKEDNILYAIYGTPAESLCFSGDTLIQTYNGDKKIKDIKEGDLVYSYNEKNKKIELKQVLMSKLTNTNAEVLEVEFDNGQKIICTPDHKFAVRKVCQDCKNGRFIGGEYIDWVEAKKLVPGFRIKSNYITINEDGHYKCSTEQYIHDINCEYFYGSKPNFHVVHHKYENKLNNDIENLEYKLEKTHKIDHMHKNLDVYKYKSGDVAGKNNPFYGKHHTENCDLLNHKVKSVKKLLNKIPVYDITVKDNHNFYVGGKNGILVHNCGLQVEQFRKIYGIIENVSDRPYVSNSFHCHVSEQMSPIEKQDKEERFWNYFNGGKIQYCRYNLGYNKEAIKTLVLRAMKKGFYEGVNLAMCYCEDCGYQQVEMDICPKCGSDKITKIDRMNGYLGFTRVRGETRYNEAKNAEISDRVSM